MDKDIHSKSPDDDLVELQQYIAQLKEALEICAKVGDA